MNEQQYDKQAFPKQHHPELAAAIAAVEVKSRAGQATAALGRREPNQLMPQVTEALEEHASLLSELSEELINTRNRFYAVLMPDAPTSCGNEAGGAVPILSPVAEIIVGQSSLVRTMLRDLRNINSRSTV